MRGVMMALLADQGTGQITDPTDYGSDLRLWLDAENGITLSGNDVIDWDDNDPDNTTQSFDVPNPGGTPVFESNASNGLPGVDFQEDPPTNGSLAQKLSASASSTDDFFARSGDQSLSFACKWVKQTDSRFNTSSTIISKGYTNNQTGVGRGWRLRIRPTSGSSTKGDLIFEQGRSNGSFWTLSALGFYDVGDLVLGSITYDGSNTSSGGTFRLYDKNQDAFVNIGSATLGSASGIGQDTLDEMIIGNIRDVSNGDVNDPFEGFIMGLWMLVGGDPFGDDDYMRRWIP